MNPPSGNITFLFTDIEGSTKLSQDYPDTLQFALDRHHSIVQEAIESNNGFVFEIIGDAFCSAFEKAEDAVRAAVDAQINLSKEKWIEAVIKVRMGIHSGDAEWTGERYTGYITLARTARVMSAAYGEQILISNNTFDLCKYVFNEPEQESGNGHHKEKSISFRDLGERRLKDVIQPIRLFQVLYPGLIEDFPPLKTLDARPNNLPVQLTSFIGREEEMRKIKSLLKQTSLLTLTGPGGTGKTRLSLQIAADLIDDFDNGVWFVEFASLYEPDLLPNIIMQALQIPEQPKQDVIVTLTDFLKEKELLIVFDNCEHIIHACSKLAEQLLSKSPKLKILATSREALRCSGEQTFGTLSLTTPEAKSIETPEQLTQYESVRLFIERALVINPNFRVTNENAPAVAGICSQLDGIPLAIELAAARISILAVEKIHERLDDRFKLLTGGKRTALPRQQTLKALIEWSYDLLSEEERILWRRLSVFSDGWTFEAAEAICADEEIFKDDMLDILTGLTEKSIVIAGEEKERFRMLETIRQYGDNKLKESGEFESITEKHLKYYSEFADIPISNLRGGDSALWMNMIKDETGNVEKALLWFIENSNSEDGIKLAASMAYYWQINGYLSKGMRFLESSVSKWTETHNHNYIRAISYLGNFARLNDDFDKAKTLFEKGLQISREMDAKKLMIEIQHRFAVLEYDKGNFEQSRKYYEENLDYYKSIDDKYGIGATLNNLGNIFSIQGDIEKASDMYTESLALRRAQGDKLGVSVALCNLGILAYEHGDYIRSKALLDESLQIRLDVGDRVGEAITLTNLGNVAFNQADYQAALALYRKSYEIYFEIGKKTGVAEALYNIAKVTFEMDEFEKALELYEESLAMCRELDLVMEAAVCLHGLGLIALRNKEYIKAEKYYSESLTIYRETNNILDVAKILISVAELYNETGKLRSG
ncbi:MAG: tetratricopeptide repeat protein [Ignavibacteria bacterium]|nr:tetratricopeptide repeat protein [Ignavibacteria bacterium]